MRVGVKVVIGVEVWCLGGVGMLGHGGVVKGVLG